MQRANAASGVVLRVIRIGLQATHAIRQLESPERNSVPIVALTAFGMKSDRERFLAAGMDGYLSKPIDPAELCAMIEGLVERSRAMG